MNKKHDTQKYNIRYVLGISLIGALGGFLFGYDWVVIGGAKPFYEPFFQISEIPEMQGWVMSSALLGCIVGSLSSGMLSNRFGRKSSLFLAAFLFTTSAIGTGASGSLTWFVFFRIWGGLGIGLASSVSPIYISEVSPASLRGRLVSINQLTIVIGILLAQIINWLIAKPVPAGADTLYLTESWNGQMGWRWMFWAETVPAVLFFILLFAVPESPRWLAGKTKTEKALRILSKIGGQQYGDDRIRDIRESFLGEKVKLNLSLLFSKSLRPILLVGVVLAFFQQWCGINVVFNYAEEVFSAAGYGVSDTLFNIVITGIINLAFTFVAIRTIDNWGRRALMITGSLGLSVVYVLVGASYYFSFGGISVLIFILTGIAVYAMTLAPVTWVVLSEIFPNRVRATAMAIASGSLWIASFLLVILFPILNNALGTHGTFWLYAGICLLGFLFIFRKLPETKGKTLEEVEKMIQSNDRPDPGCHQKGMMGIDKRFGNPGFSLK
ncbi:MAG TPA: MFS transporter [Bacteroidaceae bacterium]|nr:MFS transporter [Bacteroidaceae bacterium]